jgi:hypothetical protein
MNSLRILSKQLLQKKIVTPLVYPAYNEITSGGESDEGYRILVDVCHSTKTIYVDEDMCDYDKLNDLPPIIKTVKCLYPKYKLIS